MRQVVIGNEYKLSAPLSHSLPKETQQHLDVTFPNADTNAPEMETEAMSRNSLGDDSVRSHILHCFQSQRDATSQRESSDGIDTCEVATKERVQQLCAEDIVHEAAIAIAACMRPNNAKAAADIALKLAQLQDMGFPLHRACVELEAASLDVELAVNFLFTRS